ncbi:MAG: hypothetical protein HFI21_06435 [Lachnospiraceae bacterium]|jgi:hypothetical protein|uniref:hypothetical protein n=1 Tax=Candidatus Merdisoma sp. JLR.KK011 TaxID=3114299 RepID=UPI0014348B0D|nr:hypothetical protein [Lachnospiraceae bacterium]MCI9478626.1 hypothetical protein [Lachnospiraceae bacterium]MCI9622499.1 hypothetical protein [Lachnospiraceae bacterium]GFI07604.1 hypothetical protein IMSAGC007_00046 [Lachnospiraceae bacterium]
MLTLLFAVCMIWFFGKLFLFGLKATWGITKFLLTIVLLPFVLIIMAVSGMFYIAFFILIVGGIIAGISKN